MSETPRIGVLDGGASYQYFTLNDARFASMFARQIYLPELRAADLDDLDALVVTDRLHPGLLRVHAPHLFSFANRGRTLLVLGEVEAHSWLPGTRWENRPTNFWWWLNGEDSGVRRRNPAHPIWHFLDGSAVNWHYHGFLIPPAGVTPLVALEEQGVEVGLLLYEDRVSTNGRLIVTTLDPVYHHGSNFMPGATRFFEGLLHWLTWDLNATSRSVQYSYKGAT